MTTLLFSQISISYKVLSGGISGDSILHELSGYINTDLAEVKVDENGLDIWLVTTEGLEFYTSICSEVKQSLEKSFDARLSYSITSVDLL